MQQIFMYMNMLEAVDIDPMSQGFFKMFSGGISAWGSSLMYGVLTLICKVLGIFADLMNVAFYIFSGIDITGGDGQGKYEISVGGEKQNILDYFVLSETMTKAYLWLAIAAVGLIVIFTIYKIVKQDYFEKTGPRSKGPIFRNVAISCISFLLVIPIFWLIIHASSLLAVVVMDMMGFDVDQLAGAKVFLLSWSDGGKMASTVNSLYLNGTSDLKFVTMNDLDGRTLFTLLTKKKNLGFASNLHILPKDWSENEAWKENQSLSQFGMMVGNSPVSGTFYWYIYLVGVVITIMALYKMLLAMLQRLFKLMGLFIVAPSPISQYVLDDGQKFKTWLQESIQEGLRLVSATMSFSIFLMALSLITDVSFIDAIKSGMSGTEVTASRVVLLADGANSANDISVVGQSLDNLIDGGKIIAVNAAEWAGNSAADIVNNLTGTNLISTDTLWNLADAFLKIFMLIGAGGAITDLDQVLTPLISGGKSSLDAGQTGASAGALVSGVKSVAGSVAGGALGAFTQGMKNRKARDDGKDAGREEADKEGVSGPESGGTPPGGKGPDDGGNKPGGNGSGGAGAPEGAGAPGGAPDGNKDQKDDSDAQAPEGNNPDDPNDNSENNDGGNDENNNDGNGGSSDTGADAGNNQQPKPGDKVVGKDGKEKTVKPLQHLATRIGGWVGDKIEWARQAPKNLTMKGKNLFDSLVAKAEARQNKGGKGNELLGGLGKAGLGALKLAGKTGLGALKLAGQTAKSAAKGVGAGLKAGFKSAKGMIGTAVFGKESAKAYGDARDGAVAAENKAAAKRYEAGKQQGYAARRAEQLNAAEKTVGQKQKDVNNATNELNNAVQVEKGAAEELELAQGEHSANVVNAETNASKLTAKDKNMTEINSEISKHEQAIEKAKKSNKTIQEVHGTRDQIQEKLEAARASGNQEDIDKYESVLNRYDANNQKISKSEEGLKSAQAQRSRRQETLDIVTGKNDLLNKLGYTDPNMTSTKMKKDVAERRTKIERQLNSDKVSDEDKVKLREEKNNLDRAHEVLNDKGMHDLFDTQEAKASRNNNNLARESGKRLASVQKNYDEKHNQTVKTRNNLNAKVTELNNATNMITKLNEATDNSKYSKAVEKSGGVDKDGNFVRGRGALGRTVTNIRASGMKIRGKTVQKSVDKKDTQSSVIAATNANAASKVDINDKKLSDRFTNFIGYHNDQITQLGAQRDQTTTAGITKLLAGKNISYTEEGNPGTKKVDFDSLMVKDANGNYDVQASINNLTEFKNRRSGGNGKGGTQWHDKASEAEFDGIVQQIKDIDSSSQAQYRQDVKSHQSAISRAETARNVIVSNQNSYSLDHNQLIEKAEKNTREFEKNRDEIETFEDVINSGGKAPLSAKTRRVISEVSGQQLGEDATQEQIVQAATVARDKKRQEQSNLYESTQDLRDQSKLLGDSLRDSIVSALQSAGIQFNVEPVNNGNGNGKNDGNANSGQGSSSSQGVAAPNANQNITNINNNNTNVVNDDRENELPASSGLAQSKDLNSYYERMQVEGIKHMQTMLETMKIRNEQIKDDIDIIKRDINEIK